MTEKGRPRLFVDTWGWLALEDRHDPDHRAVAEYYRQFRAVGGLAVTTDYVLDETLTRLFRQRPFPEAQTFTEAVLASARTGYLQIQRVTSERFGKAWALRLQYRDKPLISFTDLTSFAIMHELALVEALTNDRHFRQVNLGFVTRPALA